MNHFRLIISKPNNAFYNMALDEALFENYLKTGIPFFRIYYWDSPSFSVGVSSEIEKELNLELCVKDKVNVVRRMTGGGILFHDKEVTYSFGCSKNDVGEPGNVLVSYKYICSFLVGFYQSLGIQAQYAKDMENFTDFKSPNPICAASYEKYDIVANGKKIGGNAQKRSKNFIFQHGIIPYDIDFYFMRKYLKNFDCDKIQQATTDLKKEGVNPKATESKLIESFAQCFKVELEKSDLMDKEVHRCKDLMQQKYHKS